MEDLFHPEAGSTKKKKKKRKSEKKFGFFIKYYFKEGKCLFGCRTIISGRKIDFKLKNGLRF